ncbi:DUF6443 domain-containing protein [Chitinophaga nivalis]|uniref:DUF6443 domain-containing protein n=1 Tax=Chitinophaga nivalis TaxID=2991709 RepID=A0ABT3IIR6_9BACT|nr:DUF6443 domain-containing protein [Chitinophaga nivalis]MCW3466439.1 DUF6443 domain-containing protein [Chitinophaga nivalis]MCW3483870.1 DUF6443 domain-containing protein [Chitinophaga nivalis]
MLNNISGRYFNRLLAGLLIMPFTLLAQNKPDQSNKPAATAVPLPAAYATDTSLNRITTWEPVMPTGNIGFVTDPGRAVTEVRQSAVFIDGLGRQVQKVIKQFTSGKKDWVEPTTYDEFGRQPYQYLSYPSVESSGQFKKAAFTEQAQFMSSQYPDEKVYYSQTAFDESPLNNVKKIYAPGNSWAVSGGNKPAERKLEGNVAADAVLSWSFPISGTLPAVTGFFPNGALYKQISISEQGNRILLFKDQEDKLLLKRVEITPGAANDPAGWLSTYYVYDDAGNLRIVIPPKAAAYAIANGNQLPQTIADELCFQYRYDSKNRMISLKVPGTSAVETVYDNRDRIAFTQDGNQRAIGKWMVTFYDVRNRMVLKGLYATTQTRAQLQTAMSSGVATNIAIPAGGGAPAENIAVDNALPALTIASLEPLLCNYYDDYNWQGKAAFHPELLNKPQEGINPYPLRPSSFSPLTTGLLTGTRVKVLGVDKWLYSTVYFDAKGNALQAVSQQLQGGETITTHLYDFSGKLLSIHLLQNNPRSQLTASTEVLTMNEYDHSGRLVKVRKRINNDIAKEKIISYHVYDELGQLTSKKLGFNGTSQLETLDYTYQIRGWLKAINKDYNNGGAGNYFGMELFYDNGFNNKQYDGQLAGVSWRSAGDGQKRAYGYAYDAANRLSKADFTENRSGAWATFADVDFSVRNITYDVNGNLQTMISKGISGATSKDIDNLTYTYDNNGFSNKLIKVDDNAGNNNVGDFTNGTNVDADYSYDANGSMVYDKNKSVEKIEYNYLNLPEKLIVTGKGTVKYIYDAEGNKLRKTVSENGKPDVVTDYTEGIIYQGDSLQLLSTEEGRIRAVYKAGSQTAPELVYDYFIRDHQKNVRMVLTEQTTTNLYMATMESENAGRENLLFSNVDNSRSAKPAGYPTDQTSNKNAFVARLNARQPDKKIGPSLVLRVMAGDTIAIGAKAFYKSTGVSQRPQSTPEDMLLALTQALAAPGTTPGGKGSGQSMSTAFTPDFYNNQYQRLKEKEKNPDVAGRPKAYLNYVIFDDQLKMVEENSGVKQVEAAQDVLQTLEQGKMVVRKSGLLYVYVSNESTEDVYFDNVTVAHIAGSIAEETHYYPFGMTMSGISRNALKGTQYKENTFRYNAGAELNTSLGLDYYETNFRGYDPQIGRFQQVDPMAPYLTDWSPYTFALDNPVNMSDPSGAIPEFKNAKDLIDYLWNHTPDNGYSYWQQGMNGEWTGMAGLITGELYNGPDSYSFTVGAFFGYNSDRTPISQNGLNGAFTRIEIPKADIANIDKKEKVNGTLDNVQLALDGAGFIPGAQTVAGVLNAGIDFYRGNWGSGLLNLASAIPLAGAVAKGAMIAAKLKVGKATMAAVVGITSKMASKSHSVYQAIDATGTVRYVGRTSQRFEVRVAQHYANGKTGLIFGELQTGLTYRQARKLEQQLINKYGMGSNGGQLLNEVNGISEKLWNLFDIYK